MEKKTLSLYERVGGEQAIMAAVDRFYEKMLADPTTRPFFENLDMQAQIKKQIGFMAWALGGPKEYKGRDLRSAHANLVRNKGLSETHFEAVVKHLGDTLRELGVTEDLVTQCLETVSQTRAQVLGQ